MTLLALYLFGQPRVVLNGTQIHLGRRKTTALLAYLAMTKRTHSRDALAALFWPEYSQPDALAYLRRVLSELNKSLCETGLVIYRETASLNPASIWLDVTEFHQHVAVCKSHNHQAMESCEVCIPHMKEAVTLYRGDFLEGFTLNDSAPFDEWQLFQVENLRRELNAVLERLVHWHLNSQTHETAFPYALRWLEMDPLHEPAHVSLMMLYMNSGQKSSAMRQYQMCAKLLSEELGLSPSKETTALYERIRVSSNVRSIQKLTTISSDHPLSVGHTIPNNLPAQLTSFIGREKEIREIQDRLLRPDIRLLTLTGPGGTGKTRLSLAVAQQVISEFPDGVFFIPLASLRDPALVLDAIAQAFGLRDAGDMTLSEILEINLRNKKLLLVLDNFEHVVMAAPEITALLTVLPQLKVLVTSRMLLRVTGEHIYPVMPMRLPDTQNALTPQQMTKYEAVQLFVARSTAFKPGFTLTEQNDHVVVEICTRLDGLPLAIELAAARIRLLSPDELLSQLENRLEFLTGGARDLPTRQRTLRSTIGWSYRLLGKEEQVLFRRLAVFAGGCTWQAAEAVCKAVSGISPQSVQCSDVLTSLEKLVDQSLLQQSELKGTTRFTMLETIRKYALEQLAESDEIESLQQAYAIYFLELAEQAEPQLDGPEPAPWLELLERELDNLRSALSWALENDVAVGLRLASTLENHWIFQARLTEGRTWLAQLLAKSDTAENNLRPLRARVLTAACVLAWYQGDSGTGIDLGEQSVEIFRLLGDRHGLAHALSALGQANLSFPDSTMTIPCLEESIALFREIQDTLGLTEALHLYGWRWSKLGNFARARSAIEEGYHLSQKIGALNMQARLTGALVWASHNPEDMTTYLPYLEKGLFLFQQAGNKLGELVAFNAIGNSLHLQGHYDQANRYYQKILPLWLKYGNKANAAQTLYYLGVYSLLQGLMSVAKSRFLECMEMLRKVTIGDDFIASCLFMLTKIIKVEDQPEQVATMLGAAEVLRSKTIPISEEIDNEYNRIWNAVHQYLDEDNFSTAYTRGFGMTREEAIAFGLQVGTMLK